MNVCVLYVVVIASWCKGQYLIRQQWVELKQSKLVVMVQEMGYPW